MILDSNDILYSDVLNIVDHTFTKIAKMLQEDSFSVKDSNHLLLFFSEIISSSDGLLMEYQTIAEEGIKKILSSFNELESLNNIGMMTGIGNLAFSVRTIFRKTGQLKNLHTSLDGLLIEKTNELVSNDLDYRIPNCYDLVSGVSGVLYYFLDDHVTTIKKVQLKKMVNFLDNVISSYDIPNIDQQEKAKLIIMNKRETSNNSILLSQAHGMLGCIIALSKAYSLGLNTVNTYENINKLSKLYSLFDKLSDKSMPIEASFFTKENEVIISIKKSFNSGWCCGDLSILYGLMNVHSYMGNDKLHGFYEKKFIEIISQSLDMFHLQHPILCHGFSSVLTMLVSYSRKKNLSVHKEVLREVLREVINMHWGIDSDSESENYKLYTTNNSLLTGDIGVVLTLLSVWNPKLEYTKLLMLN